MPDDARLTLPEPSLADVLSGLVEDPKLDDKRKAAWTTAIRSLCWAIGRPPEALACRLSSLRHYINRINPAAVGWAAKTLANHKSNATGAIRHVSKIQQIAPHGFPLSPEWRDRVQSVQKVSDRRLLTAFGRWCSAQGLAPSAVTGGVIHAFVHDKEQTSFHQGGLPYERKIVKAWNKLVAQSGDTLGPALTVPDLARRSSAPDWSSFPEPLRLGTEQYLDSLTRVHRGTDGKRRPPVKTSTVATRRREIIAFARKAVDCGVALESLVSLEVLLSDAVVTPTFEAYLGQNGERAKEYTIGLAGKLYSAAKAIGASIATVQRLDEIRSRLEKDRGPALTEKNLAVIRQVMSTDVWSKVVRLPEQMMREALRLRNRSPRKALALATSAVQIGILTHAPLRIGNLLSIKLGENLKRTGDNTYDLHFPRYDVKNRVDLNHTLEGTTAELIYTYIQQFRSTGGKGRHADWLFLSEDGDNRSSTHASQAIAGWVEKFAGLRITAHQFRHSAAAIILKADPGNYEFVRRVLGHRNIATTQRFYTALESFAAGKEFNKLIAATLKDRPSAKGRRS